MTRMMGAGIIDDSGVPSLSTYVLATSDAPMSTLSYNHHRRGKDHDSVPECNDVAVDSVSEGSRANCRSAERATVPKYPFAAARVDIASERGAACCGAEGPASARALLAGRFKLARRPRFQATRVESFSPDSISRGLLSSVLCRTDDAPPGQMVCRRGVLSEGLLPARW